MKALLDTCAVIWGMLSPSTLSRKAQQTIAAEENEIFVSAASAWEIATKVRLGKLRGAERLERDYLSLMAEAGYTPLPIEAADALRAGRMAFEHRDPFDRMIAAQALALDIPVVSSDPVFDAFGVRRIW